MVLGNLIGGGDAQFVHEVKRPLDPKRGAVLGLAEIFDYENELMDRAGVSRFDLAEAEIRDPILQWIKANGISPSISIWMPCIRQFSVRPDLQSRR